jgi:hypothetical protein
MNRRGPIISVMFDRKSGQKYYHKDERNLPIVTMIEGGRE